MENVAVCILFPQRQGCLLRSCWTMWYVRRASHPKGPRSEPQMKTSSSDVAISSVFRSPGRLDTVFLYQWSPVSCLKCREFLQRGNLRKKNKQGLPWQSSGYDSALPLQRVRVPFLVWELRSFAPGGTVNNKKVISKI